MGCLHTLWDISEESFRTLVKARFRSSPGAVAAADQLKIQMLGDALVPGPTRTLMRATEIDAPPDRVWPWLHQMMRGGGVYGWPALETPHCQSADYLLSNLPAPQIGDRIGDVLEVVRVNSPREIVWHALGDIELFGFRLTALTLDYLLDSAARGRCRLVVRIQGSCNHLTSQICSYLFEVLDFVLAASQLATLKDHIETYEWRSLIGDINRSRVKRHQAADTHRAAQQAGSRLRRRLQM